MSLSDDHLIWRLRHNETAKHLCGLAADEIERLRASRAKVVEANRELDAALCNYTNWTDEFGATDPEHPRVFKMLCDAYNEWHRALAEKHGGQT